jgi:XTP/dITP diphosphohydrolase
MRSAIRHLLLATRNCGKALEVKGILADLPVTLLTLRDVKAAPEVVEDGRTFRENALKKARILAHWWKGPVLADDSGLEVDALGNAPGVRSARYAGEGATDLDNNRKLLAELRHVSLPRRTARFRCVLVLVLPSGPEWVVQGTCEGRIAEEPRGGHGFGYDPLFWYAEFGQTFGEIEPDEKNRVSHRARALENLRVVLLKLIDRPYTAR